MNRLQDSLSPYLLQHQTNPVDWWPWCDEAFAEAIRRDVPIFLSVGYAACHWCHVMARESFADETIAKRLNGDFVSIKVDREERPDVDQIYMNAVQVMTGRGGWPMSVFLDHRRQPFFAGTYFPPHSRDSMAGFDDVLEAIAAAWRDRRDEVDRHGKQITAALRQVGEVGGADGAGESDSAMTDDVIDPAIATTATDRLIASLDRRHGGFGHAPKFPRVSDLLLLLHRGVAEGTPDLISAAEFTLDNMAAGGIRDHLGGGFARYSTDDQWLVPHFEKMLYDNALLAIAYTRAYQASGHRRHADVARQTINYLIGDLRDPAGGFHCSEDADVGGVEGAYAVWTPDQVEAVLPPEASNRFCRVYDITAEGNFEGRSIPHLPRPIEAWAAKWEIPAEQLERQLDQDRKALLAARQRRTRPDRDDKILAAWNGLAIEALAIAGGALDEDRYVDAAIATAEFIQTHLSEGGGRLLHAHRRGRSHIAGFLDDYAYVGVGLLALFEATGEARWVRDAERLAGHMRRHFFDDESGGFFFSADDGEALIVRDKDWLDGSLLSGNAAAAELCLRLGRLTGSERWIETARRTLAAGLATMSDRLVGCAGLVTAADRLIHDDGTWVLNLPRREAWNRMRRDVFRRFRPRATFAVVSGEAVSDLASWRDRDDAGGEVSLQVCRDFVCEGPVVGEAAVRKRLRHGG